MLAGGSVYGLAAADGVAAAMGAEGKGFCADGYARRAALAGCAGGDPLRSRQWRRQELGARRRLMPRSGAPRTRRAAALCRWAMPARAWARCAGALKGGQGSASIVTADGFTIAALGVRELLGLGDDAGPARVLGARFRDRRRVRRRYAEFQRLRRRGLGRRQTQSRAARQHHDRLRRRRCRSHAREAKRVAQMASAGLARAIRPVFAPFDGDVVFALATAQKRDRPSRARSPSPASARWPPIALRARSRAAFTQPQASVRTRRGAICDAEVGVKRHATLRDMAKLWRASAARAMFAT